MSNPSAIPELESICGSWICTSPAGTVREFSERSNVERAAAAGWKIETALQHLGRINAQLRLNRPSDGFYRLWSDNEAFFVVVSAGRVNFRGRNFSLSVEECLQNGDRFEPVTR